MSEIGGGGGQQKSSSQQRQEAGTRFPSEFLQQFAQIFGQPISLQQLIGALPTTQGLFGGGQVGVMPTYGQPVQQGVSAAGGQGVQGPFLSDLFPMQRTAGGQQQAAEPTYTSAQVSNIFNTRYQGRWNTEAERQAAMMRFDQAVKQRGLDPNNLTGGQISEIFGSLGGVVPGAKYFGQSVVPALLASNAAMAQGGPQFTTQGATLGGLNIPQGLANLQFGQMPAQAQPFQFQQIPGIQAPTAQAAQAQIAPQGWQQYEQALYESQFRPVQREIERQGVLQDRQLNAQLAQAGLASSGTGIGQLRQQRTERSERLVAAAKDAANQATVQRFGMQYQQELQNAQMRQETALANAGYDLQSQMANAEIILKGDMARAENYLNTFGANVQAVAAARDAWLNMMGIAETDLNRMDQYSIQVLSLMLNNWLQQGALVSGAGQFSVGNQSSLAKSFGISQHASFGSFGGGG